MCLSTEYRQFSSSQHNGISSVYKYKLKMVSRFKKEYIFLDYVLRGSKVTQAIIIIQYHFDQSGAEIAQPPPFCISHHFVFPAILAQPFNKCPWERDRLRALFNATRTGEHFTKGPKNLSRVYKYLTLSFASLAASVMRLSC